MNYLAHAFLSFNKPAIIVGNVTGDAVKGSRFMDYPVGFREGLLLHRYIDTYTDHHESIKAMGSFFKNKYGRYSGIVVDVLCDHLLAKNFNAFSDTPLKEFSQKVYSSFEMYFKYLPASWIERSKYMIEFDWLSNYFYLEGVEKSLQGLSRRNQLEIDLSDAVNDFLTHEEELKTLFSSFFKQINIALPTIYEDVTLKIAQLE